MNIAYPSDEDHAGSLSGLSLVPGLAIIVAVAVFALLSMASGSGNSSLPAPAMAPQPATTPAIATRSHASLLLYVVETQDEAQAVIEGEGQALIDNFAAGVLDPGYRVMVLVVDSPEDGWRVTDTLDAWMASEPGGIRLIDLRP